MHHLHVSSCFIVSFYIPEPIPTLQPPPEIIRWLPTLQQPFDLLFQPLSLTVPRVRSFRRMLQSLGLCECLCS